MTASFARCGLMHKLPNVCGCRHTNYNCFTGSAEASDRGISASRMFCSFDPGYLKVPKTSRCMWVSTFFVGEEQCQLHQPQQVDTHSHVTYLCDKIVCLLWLMIPDPEVKKRDRLRGAPCEIESAVGMTHTCVAIPNVGCECDVPIISFGKVWKGILHTVYWCVKNIQYNEPRKQGSKEMLYWEGRVRVGMLYEICMTSIYSQNSEGKMEKGGTWKYRMSRSVTKRWWPNRSADRVISIRAQTCKMVCTLFRNVWNIKHCNEHV